DAILQLRYTARKGGELLRRKALDAARLPEPAPQPNSSGIPLEVPPQSGQWHLLSARQAFSESWYRFLHPTETESVHTFSMPISPEHFPFATRGRDVHVNEIYLFWKLKSGETFINGNVLNYQLQAPNGPADTATGFKLDGPFPGIPYSSPP